MNEVENDATAHNDGDQNAPDDKMPIQDRGESERAKGPMSPKQDNDDEGGRAKGPTSPSTDS